LTSESHVVKLEGCTQVPLANYLKTLGLFRLIAEQVDPMAKGYWSDQVFILESKLSNEDIIRFVTEDYCPTPIVVPWSGNDFFAVDQDRRFQEDEDRFNKPPTSEKAIAAILRTESTRLDLYRQTITSVFAAMKISKTLTKSNIEGAGKAQKKQKAEFIQAVRNIVPDEVVFWIDAATVINEEVWFNNLLGSGGGNEGNSHFSDNFMQALWIVLPDFDAQKSGMQKAVGGNYFESSRALKQALFGDLTCGTFIPKMSQVLFSPLSVEAPNATSGFKAEAASNPWDFIFLLEGSILFAGGLVKKKGARTPKMASFPFLLGATPIGNIAASNVEGSGKEIWLPIWDKPTRLSEIKELFSAGRIENYHRAAVRGIDAVQAISQLGVDRGISGFRRIGLFKGRASGDKSLSAIDMGEFLVKRNIDADRLADINSWLSIFREKAYSKNAPKSAERALRNLEATIFTLCTDPVARRTPEVLIALGKCERTLAKNSKWAQESTLKPVPALSEKWLIEADDGSPEFRLAASLASIYGSYADHDGRQMVMPIRSQMEPVRTRLNNGHLGVEFVNDAGRDVVWSDGNLIQAVNQIMSRRIIRAVQSGCSSYPDKAWINAELGDIADFIENRIDLLKMEDLLWGLILLDWPSVSREYIKRPNISETILPGASYSILKLCFSGGPVRDAEIPIVPEIHRRAVIGDSIQAMRLASRRLKGCNLITAVNAAKISGKIMERTAAALLFPLSDHQVSALENNVLKPDLQK